MNDDEQIMEMANDLAKICPDLIDNCCGQVNCVTHLTLSLSKLRYRKVERGEWIPYGMNMTGTVGNWRCSVCNKTSLKPSNFCGWCGADMRGEKDG